MKTRIIRLKNNNMEILLCGAVHIGTQDYYNELNAIADTSEVVLFEQAQATSLDKLKLIQIKLAELLGLSRQNRIGYEDNPKWIASDMNYEIIKKFIKKNRLDQATLEKIYNLFEEIESMDEKIKSIICKLLLFIINKFTFILPFINEYVLVNLRNYNVLIDITKQFETHNTISVVYGDGHLNHLIRCLKKMNFVIVEKIKLNNLK